MEYIDRLQLAATQLRGLRTEVRGEGLAAFLFVTGPSGTIEMSESSGNIWVEFWRPDQEDAEADAEYPSYDEAIAAIRAWLSSRPLAPD